MAIVQSKLELTIIHTPQYRWGPRLHKESGYHTARLLALVGMLQCKSPQHQGVSSAFQGELRPYPLASHEAFLFHLECELMSICTKVVNWVVG
jgi:hypothetical protein